MAQDQRATPTSDAGKPDQAAKPQGQPTQPDSAQEKKVHPATETLEKTKPAGN